VQVRWSMPNWTCSSHVGGALALPLLLATACIDSEEGADGPPFQPTPYGTIMGGSATGGRAAGGTPSPDGETMTDVEEPPASEWPGGSTGEQTEQGAYDDEPVPPCEPQCTDLSYGSPDGCGGFCFVVWCWPSCDPTECGAPDGCGGTCDEGCGSTEEEDGACIPGCGWFDCETDDGCGGTCSDGC
jgi:hypothetical protein